MAETQNVNWFDVFALANQIMPLTAGKDLALVATTFAMMLGRAEGTRKPFPKIAELQVAVSNEIARWAEPQDDEKAIMASTIALMQARAQEKKP